MKKTEGKSKCEIKSEKAVFYVGRGQQCYRDLLLKTCYGLSRRAVTASDVYLRGSSMAVQISLPFAETCPHEAVLISEESCHL